jgi:hypothetical protein
MSWSIGILELWNTGFSGMGSIFYIDGTDKKLKSGHHPLFIPNIPFLHHSIIPLTT